ncbi:MAG: hypothetical protein KAY37_16465 [Phycisphaerae bacterium]|nr:hypothetical protein [Phycisphaerae bacterium]
MSDNRTFAAGCYTLIEVVISTVVVSVMLVAALHAVGAARLGLRQIGNHSRGVLLAQDLMTEILQQHYADPVYGLGSFGVDGDEATTGDRSLYDDVDDYDGWQVAPPQYKDGTEITWATEYERLVEVAWVLPSNPQQTSGSETGVKRITVTVSHDGAEVAELTALRTTGWPAPADGHGG